MFPPSKTTDEEKDMKIAIASDHGGYELKNELRDYLIEEGHDTTDLGTDSTESVDYPQLGKKCAEAVVSGKYDKGIVICGTGIGISIAANKVKGARCALCTDKFMAEMAASHNDANLLALGGRTTSFADAKVITDVWLGTKFEDGRHQRRVDQLNEMG